MFENNTENYLTQCLSFAYVYNSDLQSQMKQVFGNKEKYPNCKYQSAPVSVCVLLIEKHAVHVAFAYL